MWTSSNPSIATINGKGLATGIKVGTVTISGDCDCHVTKTNLTQHGCQPHLDRCDSLEPDRANRRHAAIRSTGTYSDGTNQTITSSVTWASSATTIATINSAGLATSVSSGVTTITASAGTVSGNTTLTVQ